MCEDHVLILWQVIPAGLTMALAVFVECRCVPFIYAQPQHV